jgi:hypothetical protein
VAIGGSNVSEREMGVGVGMSVGVFDGMGTEVKVGVFIRDAGVVVVSDMQLVRRIARNKKKIV